MTEDEGGKNKEHEQKAYLHRLMYFVSNLDELNLTAKIDVWNAEFVGIPGFNPAIV